MNNVRKLELSRIRTENEYVNEINMKNNEEKQTHTFLIHTNAHK